MESAVLPADCESGKTASIAERTGSKDRTPRRLHNIGSQREVIFYCYVVVSYVCAPTSPDAMQRFGASKTEATPFPYMQVRLSWRMTCRVPFPLLETSPLYEYEDLKGGNIPTVTRIEQVRVEGSCASRARANHDSDPIFSASVEAPPTQDSRVVFYGCCSQSGRRELRSH